MPRRIVVCVLAVAACRGPINYTAAGPRYVGPLAPLREARGAAPPDTIRVVTFNIKLARRVDSAIAVLAATPVLRAADVVALQEMDLPGTRRLAEALGMAYVYYPAVVHHSTGRDFGNAILSRWPLSEDRKVILPHRGQFRGQQRIAVGATVLVGGTPVRVYSVHLETPVEAGPRRKHAQAEAVLADAAAYPRVIIAGDLNGRGIGRLFAARGYAWPTRDEPATVHRWSWDHVFLRGLAPPARDASGVVRENRRASDHRPVWAVAVLDGKRARSVTTP